MNGVARGIPPLALRGGGRKSVESGRIRCQPASQVVETDSLPHVAKRCPPSPDRACVLPVMTRKPMRPRIFKGTESRWRFLVRSVVGIPAHVLTVHLDHRTSMAMHSTADTLVAPSTRIDRRHTVQRFSIDEANASGCDVSFVIAHHRAGKFVACQRLQKPASFVEARLSFQGRQHRDATELRRTWIQVSSSDLRWRRRPRVDVEARPVDVA